MNLPKNLQIPATVEQCIYLMRSYVYIDKYNMEVQIREISPYLAPGFILGLCAQVPFLYEFVKPYIRDVKRGKVHEVTISDRYQLEMARNQYINAQYYGYEYTQSDCSFGLSVILNAIVQSMYGRENFNFLAQVDQTVKRVSEMANQQPMVIYFPKTFCQIMQSTLICVPELRIDMMSLLCTNSFHERGVWSMVKVHEFIQLISDIPRNKNFTFFYCFFSLQHLKRYIWLPIRNYQMGTFLAIGQWYEANEKTLAHVDADIVIEMKKYVEAFAEMKAISKPKGYNLGAFRIMNPSSMLPYLRQFPCSAYCAVEWKKRMDFRWSKYSGNLNRFGVDTQVRLMKLDN